MKRYAPLFIGAIAVLAWLDIMGALILPIASMAIGFLLLGFTFPEMMKNLTGYSHTLWLPLGFVVSAVAGLFIIFGEVTVLALMTSTWCGTAPCIPIGLMLVSYLIGNASNLFSRKLLGKKLDLFGEKIKD